MSMSDFLFTLVDSCTDEVEPSPGFVDHVIAQFTHSSEPQSAGAVLLDLADSLADPHDDLPPTNEFVDRTVALLAGAASADEPSSEPWFTFDAQFTFAAAGADDDVEAAESIDTGPVQLFLAPAPHGDLELTISSSEPGVEVVVVDYTLSGDGEHHREVFSTPLASGPAGHSVCYTIAESGDFAGFSFRFRVGTPAEIAPADVRWAFDQPVTGLIARAWSELIERHPGLQIAVHVQEELGRH